jgi:hypothetical protein
MPHHDDVSGYRRICCDTETLLMCARRRCSYKYLFMRKRVEFNEKCDTALTCLGGSVPNFLYPRGCSSSRSCDRRE